MVRVNLKLMKIKALNFPEPVKSLILSEPDFIESNDFVLKLGTWEKLLLIASKNEK